jgi:hypothetical protein
MTREKIVRILELHGIAWKVREGRLWGIGVLSDSNGVYDELVPVTTRELRAWLGY